MCRSEAPTVEQFARDNADRITVVGIGAQDDLALARDFVASAGTTFTMLWSESVEAWRHFGVQHLSDFWLVDPNGNRIDNISTPFDDSHVTAHLAKLS